MPCAVPGHAELDHARKEVDFSKEMLGAGAQQRVLGEGGGGGGEVPGGYTWFCGAVQTCKMVLQGVEPSTLKITTFFHSPDNMVSELVTR